MNQNWQQQHRTWQKQNKTKKSFIILKSELRELFI